MDRSGQGVLYGDDADISSSARNMFKDIAESAGSKRLKISSKHGAGGHAAK
ncbi:MAG: hypothetical protein JW384_02947 [Nitrosomonadaceae bacterium]|nr:hypothetical protein [Nitrosomonadaceae bacterium]